MIRFSIFGWSFIWWNYGAYRPISTRRFNHHIYAIWFGDRIRLGRF